MSLKKSKTNYQPPYARDIFNILAFGQITPVPEGWCSNGAQPTQNTCTNGTDPTQSAEYCAPTGSLPLYGGCLDGTNVLSFCTVGSQVPPA